MTRLRITAAALLAGAAIVALANPALATSSGKHHKSFDLQAHRGGLGLVVESTLDSFASGPLPAPGCRC